MMTNFKKGLVNFFGSLGYLACLLQWLWAVILYSDILKSIASSFQSNAETAPVVDHSTVGFVAPSLPVIIFGAVVVLVMIALTIWVIVKVPSEIAKASKKVVGETAERVAPFVLKFQHKKITEKNRKKLTPRIIILIKLILLVLPIALAFSSILLDKPVFVLSVVTYATLFLACISLIFFVLQYILAKLFSINRQDIR